MRRNATTFLLIAIVVGACTSGPSIGTDAPSETAPPEESSPSSSEVTLPPADEVVRATVEGVIDGDTLQAAVNGQRVEIRLIGINAPEGDECHGDESRTALASLVTGQTVVLASDGPDSDSAGRALRYVLIEGDPAILVNAELISSGGAVPLHSGHVMEAEFLRRGDRAYASGNGMWGTFVCGHPDTGVSPDRPQLRIGDIGFAAVEENEFDPIQEWFEIVNQSYNTVDIIGWTVRNEAGDQRLEIPVGTTLSPGTTLRIVTGCGTNSSGILHWCSDSAIWSTGGNTIILQDRLGNVVERKVFAVDG